MKYYLTIFTLLIALRVNAQLSVGSNGMTLLAGTALTVDGLTLTPSANLTIANNSIQKSSTPIAGNPSINRVYQFSSPLLFSGTAGINYLTSELNGYNESVLQLAYAPATNTPLTVTTGSSVNTSTHYVSNSLTNKNLFVVTATALSDLTPILYARPITVYQSTPFTLIVDVVELNSVDTKGSFTVKVSKDQLINLSFDQSLTILDGRSVQNSAWTFSASDPAYYILSTSQSVVGGDRLSFGLNGMLSPNASSGSLTISTTIQPITLIEAKLTNNVDADKIDYFQQ